MKLAFDIGMYDGADSRYFLDEGLRVVAVEANPELVEKARLKFRKEIAAGHLILVNKALAERSGEIELALCGDDLGASTIFGDKIAHRNPSGTLKVPAVTFAELVDEHGIPDYVKVDVEGADRHCVMALNPRNRPQYLSFEADDDLQELVSHAASIGYTRFKLIGQCSFLELGNERALRTRLKRKLSHWLGRDEPRQVRRAGRWFWLMHSSGPAPWESDGNWYTAAALMEKWNHARQHQLLTGWYDVHACA